MISHEKLLEILHLHGIDRSSLYEKINLLDEAAVVRGLNSLSRTRAALRDMLEESEKRVGQV